MHGQFQHSLLHIILDKGIEVGFLENRQVGVVAHNLVRIAIGRVTHIPAALGSMRLSQLKSR